ncbi:MAG: hypothetical protein ACR2GG_01090 [Gemmatimonadaceae bacterium]
MQLARARRRVLIVDADRPRNRFARTAHGFLGQYGRTPAAILETARAQGWPTRRPSSARTRRRRQRHGMARSR